MKISLVPDRPTIFLGQKFNVQININSETNVKWISAQITGKTITLNNQTSQLLHNIVKQSLGGPQNAPYFGHVMSGSRLIANDFSGSKTLCLSILADDIPPSYDGEGVCIKYELMIAFQTSTQIDKSHVFPIRFIAPFKSKTLLEKCQANAKFEIENFEAKMMSSIFYLSSMFVNNPSIFEKTEFIIKQQDLTICKIITPLAASSGKDVTFLIDFSDSNIEVQDVTISLIKIEVYSNENANQSKCIIEKKIKLKDVILRSVSLPILQSLTAEFETDLITLKYSLVFVFKHAKGSSKTTLSFSILPQEYSNTRPMIPI